LPVGAPLQGGSLPVAGPDDVLGVFDDDHRAPDTAVVRDGFVLAFTTGFLGYQSAASYAAAQCDPLRATGDYLRSLASEHGIIPNNGETDAGIQNRIFLAPQIVTPLATADQINNLIAPFTTSQCIVLELGCDCWFVSAGDASWDSFVSASDDVTHHYQDRLYPDDAAENGGLFFSNAAPHQAIPSPGIPRSFHVRAPSLAAADQLFAFVSDSDNATFFVDAGDAVAGPTFIFQNTVTEEDLYEAIIGLVDSIKGQGMTWSLYVDPSL
jgi:hypothetical protein